MFDVAVVGCGPVGAFAANLLGKAGLSTLVIERAGEVSAEPRAIHVDHEMVRLFQSVGLSEVILADMRAGEGHLHIGADGGVIKFMGSAGRPRPFGWANDYFFFQPELEAHLRKGMTAYPDVELRLNTELLDWTQDSDAATLRLGSGGAVTEVRARWVIACDGASSKMRRDLGVTLEDLDFEEPWLVVDADVDCPVGFPELTGLPPGTNLQALSVMICDPKRPATVVPGRGRHRRWEFMLLPSEDDTAMMQPEEVSALLEPYLGGVPHRILRSATYRFHGLIAEHWRDDRIFLAGDAAHQTPPYFGQGLCHGMRDVANLVWKLALVVRERASPTLLDSYQQEREPQVRAVVSAAIAAGRYICILDPDAAAQRDAQMRERARGAAPATASDLIAPLVAGFVDLDSTGAGERFIQPWTGSTGQKVPLDERTGSGWRLFTSGGSIAQARIFLGNQTLPMDIAVIDIDALEDNGKLRHWLDERGANAVLVRPDFYVFGTVQHDVTALLRQVQSKLTEEHRPEVEFA